MIPGELIGGAFVIAGRPAPAPTAPPRQALREVYEHLLEVEHERLAVAVRIERERGIVFPETSVIVRDVRTLAEKLYGPGAGGPAGAEDGEAGGGQPRPGREADRGEPVPSTPLGAILEGLEGAEGGDIDELLAELGLASDSETDWGVP